MSERTKQLFITDLNKYPSHDLQTMAKYYGIKKSPPNATFLTSLASKIMAGQSKKAHMAAGAEDCSNDTDFITQEEWTEKPDIKIHFLDWDDPDKKPYTVCLEKDSFEKWTSMPENYFARWVQKDPKKPMNTEGRGGHPLKNQLYLKMPDGVTFIENLPTELRGVEQVGLALDQVRLGTLKGTFRMSELHGQAPGYKVYRLMPKAEYGPHIWMKLLREYIGKNQDTHLKMPGTKSQSEAEVVTVNTLLAAIRDENVDIERVKVLLDMFTNIRLNNSEINNRTASALAKAIETNTTLTTLKFWSNKIGDSGASAFAKALEKNSTLMTISLSGNEIGDPGASDLAKALEKNSTLTTLWLSTNEIGDVGVSDLAKALEKNSTLSTLWLKDNKISDVGASDLAKALEKNSTLTTLRLEGNKIGDVGASAFVKALKKNSTLILYLSGNEIGEELEQQISHTTNERRRGRR